MKNLKLYISIILAIILSNSLTFAGQIDGNSLLHSIKSNDHENVKSIDGFFDGYINGVADATVDISWCPPHDLQRSQAQKIVTKYYKANPSDASESPALAKDLILHALIDAYPCKK